MKTDEVVSEVLGEESILTPSDLYNRRFERVIVGGYKPREVDEYLERVADVLESLIQQVRDLKEERTELKATMAEFRQTEATLRDALVKAQQFGDDVIEAAKREASAIIEEARAVKERMRTEATQLPEGLNQEILELRTQRNRLRSELLAILASHRTLVDSLIPAETPDSGGKAPAEAQARPVAARGTPPPPPSVPAKEPKEATASDEDLLAIERGGSSGNRENDA